MERSLRILFLAAAGLALTAPAFAQPAGDLGKTLVKGINCAAPATVKASLSDNVDGSKAAAPDLVATLNDIASDANACQPLRDAAHDKVAELTTNLVSKQQDEINTASRAVVDAALADADKQVASLKFEVGPPPRNLTRGRELPASP